MSERACRVAADWNPLAQDESFFRTLAEMIPQMVWTKDAAGRNDFCSQKLLQTMNVTLDEFLYTPWDMVHPDDAERGRAVWETARSAGTAYEVELRMRPKHSMAFRWFLVRAVPYFDAAGRLVKWFGTTTDIDAQAVFAKRQEAIATGLIELIAPAGLPVLRDLIVDAIYTPAEVDAKVGGDFYFALTLPDDRILFAIGDVAGHGLLAAVAMDRVRNAIVGAALDTCDPAAVLAKVNRILILQDQPIVTAIVGFIQPGTLEFRYASAGHPAPIFLSGGVAERCPYGGLPLGVTSEPHFGIVEGRVRPGTMLVLYTDGLIEFDRDAARGEARLIAAARGLDAGGAARSAHDLARIVLDGATADDDIAIMTICGAPVVSA